MRDDENDQELPEPRRFRLIPLTVIMLALLLVVKINELYIGSQQLREFYALREASASGSKPEEKADKHDAVKPEGDTKEAAHGSAEKKDKPKKDDAKKDEEKPKDAGHGEASGGHGEGSKPPPEPKTFGTGKSTIKEIEALKEKNATAQRFNKTEIDLLENLSKRRDELDGREKDLEIKTSALDATQKRIDDKIAEMKTLEAELSRVIALYNEKQNTQITSLVKIYEAMKPIQAAAIFNELDLPILLEVIDKMAERRVAPVLALMDPKKARDVTQELAAMRKSAPKVPGAVAPKP